MDYESNNQTQDPQFNQTATDQGTADQNKKRGKAFFAIIGIILAMIVAAMIPDKAHFSAKKIERKMFKMAAMIGQNRPFRKRPMVVRNI